MTAAAAAAALVVAVPLGTLARAVVAGRSRPPLPPRLVASWFGLAVRVDAVRLAAGLTALYLTAAGSTGDVLVAAVAATVAAGPRLGWGGVGVLAVAASGAARVGSTNLADVGGGHEVLGAPLASGSIVTTSAVLALGVGVLAVATVLTPVRRRARRPWRVTSQLGPGALSEVVPPFALALLVLGVAGGPPVSGRVHDVFRVAARIGGAAGVVVVAGVARRVAGARVLPWLGPATAVAGVLALGLGGLA